MDDKKKKGFALIEVLIAITLITMLAAIVIIAVNPARQFSQGRDTQRWAAVNAILNAVHQNMVDNQGNFNCPNSIPAVSTRIGDSTSVPAGVDICTCLVPTYLAGMPYDPSTSGAHYTDCTDYDTGYEIFQSASTGRITVEATFAELQTIIVTR